MKLKFKSIIFIGICFMSLLNQSSASAKGGKKCYNRKSRLDSIYVDTNGQFVLIKNNYKKLRFLNTYKICSSDQLELSPDFIGGKRLGESNLQFQELKNNLKQSFIAAQANIADTNRNIGAFYHSIMNDKEYEKLRNDIQIVIDSLNSKAKNNAKVTYFNDVMHSLKEVESIDINPIYSCLEKTHEDSLNRLIWIYYRTLNHSFLDDYFKNHKTNYMSKADSNECKESLISLQTKIQTVLAAWANVNRIKTLKLNESFTGDSIAFEKISRSKNKSTELQAIDSIIKSLQITIDEVEKSQVVIQLKNKYSSVNMINWISLISRPELNPFIETKSEADNAELLNRLRLFLSSKLKDTSRFYRYSLEDYAKLIRDSIDLDKKYGEYHTIFPMKEFLVDTMFVNRLVLPKRVQANTSMNLFFCYDQRHKGATKNKWDELLTTPLPLQESKFIYVMNLPKDVSLFSKQKETTLDSDNPAEELDGLLTGLKEGLNNPKIASLFQPSTTTMLAGRVRINSHNAISQAVAKSINLKAVSAPTSIDLRRRNITHGDTSTQKLNKKFDEKQLIDYSKVLTEYQQSLDNYRDELKSKAIELYSQINQYNRMFIKEKDDQKEVKIILDTAKYNKLVYQLRKDSMIIQTMLKLLDTKVPSDFKEIKFLSVEKPKYHTECLELKSPDEKKVITTELMLVNSTNKDTMPYKKFSYKVGGKYRLGLSIGVAYTLDEKGAVTYKVDIENDQVKSITNTTQFLRPFVGLNWYFWRKSFLLDQSLLGIRSGRIKERISLSLGAEISAKPFDNVYLGLNYDIIPGLKVGLGMQGSKKWEYEILNNYIVNKSYKYKCMPFVSFSISPGSTLTNLLALVNVL